MAAGGKNYCSILSPSCGQMSSLNARNGDSDNTILECRVCNEVYSLQGDKVPRLLICGHTVCHQCLSRFPLHDHSLLCPFDRQPTTIGDSGVWGLKKNFALLELLEKLQFSQTLAIKTSLSADALRVEKQLSIPCDENEEHIAVLYCTVCSTNLCVDCADMSHATRTLARHKKVPLSEKPKEVPKCQFHPMHLVEFACLEDSCQNCPLMCYICKDYGRHAKHKHTLLDIEAEIVRSSIISAVQQSKSFGEEVQDWARRIGAVIQQIEGSVQVVQGQGGVSVTQHTQGTAENAREKVKKYFSELRETLNCQEVAAYTVIDTHIRERLCMLRQQQEDMAVLLSQISAVGHQCETTLVQENSRVIIAKQEVRTLQETIQKQQQQFLELPEQLPLDPAIPITFTKDNRVHLGPKLEMRVVTLGLDGAGKTSILFKLKQNEFIQTIPTIGFNVETIEYKNLRFTIWDVGGLPKLRPLWKHYYLNTQALIFVVDSSNRERLQEAYSELVKLVQETELKDASLLIFANKQDVQPCVSIEDITREFNLFKLCCNRSWHIQACDATSGYGLCDGLEWFSRQTVAADPLN